MGIVLCLLVVAVSYGWGMRGTLLGHGRGALLPGALCGAGVALLSGNAVLLDNWTVCAAFGAIGMYYGGGMTYGETVGMVVGRYPPPHFIKGTLGLAFKGMQWFGIAGVYLGLGVRFVFGGLYTPLDLLLLTLLPAVMYPFGVLVFNRPHDHAKGIYPSIYLSTTRAESWGGYLMVYCALVLYCAVRGDTFTLMLALAAAVGGGVGWAAGILLYYATYKPAKTGKYVFGRFQKRGMIDNWKIMECTLGAVGGLAIGIGFLLAQKNQSVYTDTAAAPLLGKSVLFWGALAWFAMVILVRLLPKVTARIKQLDYIEMLVYTVVPFFFLAGGSHLAAALICGTLLLWVLFEKMCFESFRDYAGLPVIRVAFAAACAAVLGLQIAGVFPQWLYPVIWFGAYILCTLMKDFRPARFADAKQDGIVHTFRSWLTVDGYFLLAAGLVLLLYAVR